jgi:hypothetical protein
LHFSEDSPERDFAAIEFLGRKVWMKIDYYDAAMEFGSRILPMPRSPRG